MKQHIKSLIDRLSRYSEKLDNIALFADKKWVLIDENGNQQTYIFKRDGKLIMSLSGKVKMGTWEYLAEAKSILIDRVQDQILLNHAFFDQAIMILKYDGTSNDDLFILADQNVIPNLDVNTYLKSLLHTRLNVRTYKLGSDNTIEIFHGDDSFIRIGMEVTINGDSTEDRAFMRENVKYYINDSKISRIAYLHEENLKNGSVLLIEQKDPYSHQTGDKAYIDKLPAPTGKYKINFFKNYKVVDGIIVL